jgi:hypothetical protein
MFSMIEISNSAENSVTEGFQEVVITGKYKEEMTGGQIDIRDSTPGKESFSVKYLLGDTNRFELIDDSVLINQNGKYITPDKLRVPCKAMVDYQTLSNGKRNIIALQVSKILSGSTEKWTEPLPH